MRWAASASRSTHAACSKVVRVEPDHVRLGDAKALARRVHETHFGLAGVGFAQVVEGNGHQLAALDAHHGARAAALQEADGAVSEVAAVFGVERNRVGAAQLVPDVLVRERDLQAALAQPALDLGLHLSREIHFGEANVAVLVTLDVLQLGELGRVETIDQPLGEHGDAEMPVHRPALDDGALHDVADGGEGDQRLR